MKNARRALTTDDVDDVLDVISEVSSVIDANLAKFVDHQARIIDATAKLNDLARRLREGEGA